MVLWFSPAATNARSAWPFRLAVIMAAGEVWRRSTAPVSNAAMAVSPETNWIVTGRFLSAKACVASAIQRGTMTAVRDTYPIVIGRIGADPEPSGASAPGLGL